LCGPLVRGKTLTNINLLYRLLVHSCIWTTFLKKFSFWLILAFMLVHIISSEQMFHPLQISSSVFQPCTHPCVHYWHHRFHAYFPKDWSSLHLSKETLWIEPYEFHYVYNLGFHYMFKSNSCWIGFVRHIAIWLSIIQV